MSILPPWPFFDPSDIEIAKSVLVSGKVNYLTGSHGRLFESEFSSFCNNKHSVAVANGSVALSLAYRAIGIRPGDEVITTPRSFIATASEIVLLGGVPVFADVDLDSGCITAKTIEPLITSKTRAISVVHFAGWPADMHSICDLARAYNLATIEDCSQAHGALISGKPVGSFSDISTWSFCQDKIITTGGEGGMVSTSKSTLYDYIWSFKDHGKDQDEYYSQDYLPGFRWLHRNFGTNYRLTEFQSALGRLALTKLPEWHYIRKRNAHILIDALESCSCIRIPLPSPDLTHAWYKFYCYIDESRISSNSSRDDIIKNINAQGYPAYYGGCSEIYLENCFNDVLAPNHSILPNARLLGDTSLMLLVHPTIDADEMVRYASLVKSVIKNAEL